MTLTKAPVPQKHDMVLPRLRLMSDGQGYGIKQMEEAVIADFALSVEQTEMRVGSGQQTQIYNRISYSNTDCKHAGYIERIGNKQWRITLLGLEAYELLEELETQGRSDESIPILREMVKRKHNFMGSPIGAVTVKELKRLLGSATSG